MSARNASPSPTPPTQRDARAFYDQLYAEASLADDSRYLYRLAIRLLKPLRGQRLLDVACGEGHLLWQAQQAGLRLAGVDISIVAIQRAHDRCAEAALCVAAGEALPFADQTFDYLTSLGSLEHYQDMGRGVEEMRRVLKPAGVACIVLPNAFWLGDVLEVLRYGECRSASQIVERHGTRQAWRRLLEAHGFAVHATYRHNRRYPLVLPGSRKIKSVRKWLWRGFFNWVTPLNLSLEFAYLCRKR